MNHNPGDSNSEDRIFEILIIDDNPADARLLREAWRECRVVKTNVRVLEDTKDAIVYLRRAAPYEDAVRPDLILLDYKMPVDGGIALTEIKGDPDYLHLPVAVITGSANPHDALDAYRRRANCVYRKPTHLDEFLSFVDQLAVHWFINTTLPPRERPRSPGYGT